MVAEYYGSTTRRGQIIARADSGISELADLEGSSFCTPSALHVTGHILPWITMKAAGIEPEEDLGSIRTFGSNDDLVEAVRNGGCDAGSTYVDARESVRNEYPDVMDEVVVIELTPGMPNPGIQFVPQLDAELRNKLVDAFLAVANNQEAREAIRADWTDLVRHDDSFYDPLRELLRLADVALDEFAW
jgi:phosphonate transport system substrate-binding protein